MALPRRKQSAAALPCSNPNALPLKFVWGFCPLAKTGHPKNWLSGIPVSTKLRRMLCLLGLLLFSMMLILPVAGMEDLDGIKVDYGRMHG